jgi:CRP-like cAMP-binding protein
VDDLPLPPRQDDKVLDFPAETKALARGSLLLDLPAAVLGAGDFDPLEPVPVVDVTVTAAASPSTLRKHVLAEARRLETSLRSDTATTAVTPPLGEASVTTAVGPSADEATTEEMPVARAAADRVSASEAVTAEVEVEVDVDLGDAAEPSADVFDADEESVLRQLADVPPPERGQPAPGGALIPLFSDLPRPAFLELVERLEVRRLGPGSVIVREGDVGEALFVVSAGMVRVLKRRSDGREVEVARLGPGSFFGEFALLGDQRRHATVISIDDVELFEVSRKMMAELSAAHPEVLETLRRFYRERLLATLLETSLLFQPLSSAERAQLAARLCMRRFLAGQAIVEEGRPSGGLYLIMAGGVEVSARTDGRRVVLGQLGEGSYFGEMSLLRGGVATATVRASALTEVVQVPARDFYQVMAAHPTVWQEIRREAARREARNAALLTGRAPLT